MPQTDTIFALSSGAPPSAIAIIRISGPGAQTAIRSLVGIPPPPRRAVLRRLIAPLSGLLLDQGLVLWFPGPDTATGEDLAELHLHGGRAVVRAVEAELALMPGLRAAQAGEFTRRAFANNRLDLAEAEALGDLLAAETEVQRRGAMARVSGQFSGHIEGWRVQVLALSAAVEAALDFADEEDVAEQGLALVHASAGALADEVAQLLALPAAEKLRDGVQVVLAGPPNSGKSTLINALSGIDAAIVSDIAGTTRDRIEVPVALDGVPFVLTDTAGLREYSDDPIEIIGIKRAHEAIAASDLVLWLGPEGAGPVHPALWEIDAQADRNEKPQKSVAVVRLSAVSGLNMDDLRRLLVEFGKNILPHPDSFSVNRRQREHLAHLNTALLAAEAESDALALAEELRLARRALDAITGRTHTEDMLDTLFGAFCIGK